MVPRGRRGAWPQRVVRVRGGERSQRESHAPRWLGAVRIRGGPCAVAAMTDPRATGVVQAGGSQPATRSVRAGLPRLLLSIPASFLTGYTRVSPNSISVNEPRGPDPAHALAMRRTPAVALKLASRSPRSPGRRPITTAERVVGSRLRLRSVRAWASQLDAPCRTASRQRRARQAAARHRSHDRRGHRSANGLNGPAVPQQHRARGGRLPLRHRRSGSARCRERRPWRGSVAPSAQTHATPSAAQSVGTESICVSP